MLCPPLTIPPFLNGAVTFTVTVRELFREVLFPLLAIEDSFGSRSRTRTRTRAAVQSVVEESILCDVSKLLLGDRLEDPFDRSARREEIRPMEAFGEERSRGIITAPCYSQ